MNLLVDSKLDWGQNLIRAKQFFNSRRKDVRLWDFGWAD